MTVFQECRHFVWIALVALVGTITGFHPRALANEPGVEFDEREWRRIQKLSPLPPTPPSPTNRYADDPRAARLGHWLFFEPALSANSEVACATCHVPLNGFADGEPLGSGLGPLTRHTPSLWNVAQQRWFFWDGRADSLWSQALEPFEEPAEFGSSRVHVVRTVGQLDHLRVAYEECFGKLSDFTDESRFPLRAGRGPAGDRKLWDAMTPSDRDLVNRVFVRVGKALEAYQRRLVTAPTAFDRFVAEGKRDGTSTTISAAAQRGLRIFVGKGNCRTCHFGPLLSDGEFHDTGVPTTSTELDPGRYEGITKLQRGEFNAASSYSDAPDGATAKRLRTTTQGQHNWGSFKTPSLRNVAQTAPYMHRGQLRTLEDVVRFYSTLEGQRVGHHEQTVLVPLGLTEREIQDVVAFLRTLSSSIQDESLLAPPNMKKSGATKQGAPK